MKTPAAGFLVFVLAVLSLAACGRKEKPSALETPATSVKAVPPFYYDLGSPIADVSGYPESQKANYRFFLGVCGSCHTTARPLNSPYVEADVWKRYVQRMHHKMKGRGIELDKVDEGRIIDFLVYDSKIRKTDRRKEFDEQQKQLRNFFETMAKEANAKR